MSQGFRRSGVSFLFLKTKDFLQPRDIQMVLLDREEIITLSHQEVYSQMMRCSNDLPPENSQNLYRILVEQLGNLLDSHFQVINLRSNFLLLWNFFLFWFILLLFLENMFIIVVLNYSIDQQVSTIFNNTGKGVVDCLLLVDMLLIRPRVGFEVKGRRLSLHSQTIHSYLVRFFLVDLIAIVILTIDVLTFQFLPLVKIFFFLKILTIREINKQISERFLRLRLVRALFRFFKYTYYLVIFTFFFACLYTFSSVYTIRLNGWEYQHGFAWLASSPSIKYVNVYEDFQWYVWIEYALFLWKQTTRGCGYGVATPRSPPQMLVVSLGTLFIISGFVYYTIRIVDIIEKYGANAKELNDHYTIVKEQGDIPERVVEKQRSFMTQIYKDEIKIIRVMEQSLSKGLQREFNYFHRQHFFIGLPLLSAQLSSSQEQLQFLKDLASAIKMKGFYQREFLYRKNVISEPILYLSQSDQIVSQREAVNYYDRSAWGLIGLRQFFIDSRSLFDIKAENPLIVQYLEHSEFRNILRKYPEILHLFCQEIDTIKIGKGCTKSIALTCPFCSNYHLPENCSLLFQLERTIQTAREDMIPRGMEREKGQRKSFDQKRMRGISGCVLRVDQVAHSMFYFEEFNTRLLIFN